jgi:hypothetical protein
MHELNPTHVCPGCRAAALETKDSSLQTLRLGAGSSGMVLHSAPMHARVRESERVSE